MSRADAAGRSEALLSLLEVEALVVVDADGEIRDWNPGAEALFGWTRGEAVGRSFVDLVDLKIAGGRRIEALRTTGATAVTRSGSSRDLEVRWASSSVPPGSSAGQVWLVRDVTDARVAARRLRVSDDRYRWLFQAMDAAFWQLDFNGVGRLLREARAEGVTDLRRHFAARPEFVESMMRATRIIEVNERTATLFGTAEPEDDGGLGSVAPFWPRESWDVFAGAVLAALGGQTVYVRETVLQSNAGRRFDALFTACLPPDGVAEGVLLIGVVDITERLRAQRALEASEARQRHLVRHLPIPLVQLDMSAVDGVLERRRLKTPDLAAAIVADDEIAREIAGVVRIVDLNAEAQKLFGVPDAAALQGETIAFAWRTRPDTLRRSLLARLAGQGGYAEETQVDTLDGRTIDVIYTIAFDPTLVAQGVNVVGFLDISERVETQRSLARLQADLAHAGRVAMLGELTASIAHEVNQPLAAIATNASTGLRWLDRPEPELGELREITRSIVADAHRAASTIQRIRTMAAGGRPDRCPLDLSEVVRDVIEFLGHEIRARSVVADVALPTTPAPILGDRTQIQQVLVNLVLNALQALDQSSPAERRLWVSVQVGGTSAEVAVRDNGPGLAPEARNRLFDPFVTTKSNGMGMGLAICRSIVEAHGGAIVAASPEPGEKGAAFVVTLPLSPSP